MVRKFLKNKVVNYTSTNFRGQQLSANFFFSRSFDQQGDEFYRIRGKSQHLQK
jgi:predicted porin